MCRCTVFMVLFICTSLHISGATECGVQASQSISAYIYDGTVAKPHSWPWHVFLYFPDTSGRCGGSIINKRWVVTAAHCVEDEVMETIVLKAGTHDLSKQENSRMVFDIEEVHIHHKYVKAWYGDDIALLKLGNDIAFSNYIRPVCLPKKDVPAGTICTAVGWGYIDKKDTLANRLRQSRMTIKEASYCRSRLSKPFDNDTMICADDYKDTCQGDSGGGLVYRENGVYYLQGITSWGEPICGDRPDAFVRVTTYKSWIEGIAGGGLSTGAIVGIVFGAIGGVILIGLLIWLICRMCD